jgi:uncharacterized protein YndB with AHSA1/START domain
MHEREAGADRYDWTRFEINFYYDESPDTVRARWVTSGGLESFFLGSAEHFGPDGRKRGPDESVAPGDRYRWTWRHGHSVEGRYLEPADPAALAFTFGPMRVDVRLFPVREGSRLVLEQTSIEDSEQGRMFGHMNCRICWVFFLTNLKSVLSTGADLRHENPGRANAHEVGFRLPAEEQGAG